MTKRAAWRLRCGQFDHRLIGEETITIIIRPRGIREPGRQPESTGHGHHELVATAHAHGRPTNTNGALEGAESVIAAHPTIHPS